MHPGNQWNNLQHGQQHNMPSTYAHLRPVPPPPPILHGPGSQQYQQHTPPVQFPPYQTFPHLKSVAPPPPIGLQSPRCQWPPSNYHGGYNTQHSGAVKFRDGKSNGFRPNKRDHVTKNNNPARTVATKMKIFCEVCDRTFANDSELAEHLSLHKVCGIDGCQFSAHPKIVAIHVQTQHDTGLFKKLILGTAPEEVALWREERRKRFPTRANIQLKLAADKERYGRGERINKPRGRFAQKRNWRQAAQLPVHTNQRVPPPTPIETRPENNESNTVVKQEQVNPANPPKVASAIAILIANYGTSDSEDSDEAPEQCSISREPLGPPPPEMRAQNEKVTCQRPQPVPTMREKYMQHRRPPTLLQKLLESEIRHERNIILQCVRYIVQNNFFRK